MFLVLPGAIPASPSRDRGAVPEWYKRSGNATGRKTMMKRHLDQRLRLQLLRVVTALEVHGSLLKASSALGVTQPALTKSLRDIEDIAGAPLFKRHARGVQPTESGKVLIRSARRILAELKRAEEDLDQLSNPFGGIAAVGGLPVASAGLLPGVVLKLRQRHPNFNIRLEEGRTEELLPLLAAGQIDLIVGRFYEPLMPDGFCREELWVDPMMLVARKDHPLLESAPLDLSALSLFDFILQERPQRVAAEIEPLLAPLGLSDAHAIRAASYAFTREVLLSSDAFTIMPPMVFRGDIHRELLGARALPIDAPTRSAGIITVDERKLNGAALAFIACLREHVEGIIRQGLPTILASARQAGEV
jgi:LysR family transcriptional regulator, pca operon transcriptional activator